MVEAVATVGGGGGREREREMSRLRRLIQASVDATKKGTIIFFNLHSFSQLLKIFALSLTLYIYIYDFLYFGALVLLLIDIGWLKGFKLPNNSRK